jgi:putative two-component system response regulator
LTDANGSKPDAASGQPRHDPEPPGSPHRILYVGSTDDGRDSLLQSLSQEGYSLGIAGSASEALAVLRSRSADLVLAEYELPGMDGIQLLATVRKFDPTIGYVLLVRDARASDGVEALRRGADDYVVDPFELDEIRHVAQRTIRHRRLSIAVRETGLRMEAELAAQARRIERAFVDALLALTAAVESRDGYEGSHVERVAAHAIATARALGLDAGSVRTLRIAALFHDIGKIAIPEEILRKPSRLTPAEDAVLRRHPTIAAAIARRSDLLRPAVPAILHQHERWDGGGYPLGLAGSEIPLESRILGVAEAYDALVTTRPYRRGCSGSEAISELRRCAGAQFDADVVDAFIRSLGEPASDDVPLFDPTGDRPAEVHAS